MTERVVIVGGTSGIGLATARRVVETGGEVMITGRTAAKLDEAVASLGASAGGWLVDAADAGAMKAFFTDVGQVDPIDHVVVTVTGRRGGGPFRALDPAELRQAVEEKLLPQTISAQAALEVLRPDGSLTFVTAVSATAALPETAGLAAVNAAIEAMVSVLAVELAPVRVNAVSPGVIDTPWWDFLDRADREAAFAGFAGQTPARRVGRAEDVAGAIAFLMENTFTTGVVLPVDGGARLA